MHDHTLRSSSTVNATMMDGCFEMAGQLLYYVLIHPNTISDLFSRVVVVVA